MKIFVNILTMTRFFGIIGLSAIKNIISRWMFLVYIIILLLTDWLDGFLARKFRVQTLFGSIMDTIADKIFNITLLVFLAQINNLFLIVLMGELIIAIINSTSFILGKKTFSSLFGKIKMWALSISIVCGYINYFSIANIEILIKAEITITAILQLLAIYEYIKTLINQRNIKKEKTNIKNAKDLKYILFDTNYYLSKV